jgi:hypothetical protein
VAKYAANCGGLVWIRSFGSNTEDLGYGIAVDGSGNAIVTGFFAGSANFGAGLVLSNGPFADVFVAKYAADGTYLWAHTLYGPSVDIGRAAAVDKDGNVLIAGSFQSIVSDGMAFALGSVGSVDAYLIKYSPTGAYLWWRGIGGSGDEVPYGIAVDKGGNIAMVGSFQNTLNLGGNTLTSAGLSDGFIAKFSPMGNPLWSRAVGGAGIDVDYDVAMDGGGNVVLVGSFQNSVNFGTGSLTSAGQSDIAVAKYSATGVPLWSKRFGGTSDDAGLGLAINGSGNVFVTGYFHGTGSFGGGSLTSAGNSDAFLLNIGP